MKNFADIFASTASTISTTVIYNKISYFLAPTRFYNLLQFVENVEISTNFIDFYKNSEAKDYG